MLMAQHRHKTDKMEKNYASTFDPGWHLPLAEGDSSHRHPIDLTSTPQRTKYIRKMYSHLGYTNSLSRHWCFRSASCWTLHNIRAAFLVYKGIRKSPPVSEWLWMKGVYEVEWTIAYQKKVGVSVPYRVRLAFEARGNIHNYRLPAISRIQCSSGTETSKVRRRGWTLLVTPSYLIRNRPYPSRVGGGYDLRWVSKGQPVWRQPACLASMAVAVPHIELIPPTMMVLVWKGTISSRLMMIIIGRGSNHYQHSG